MPTPRTIRAALDPRQSLLAVMVLLVAFTQTHLSLIAQEVDAPSSIDSLASEQPPANDVTRAFDRYVVQGGWVTIFGLIPLSIAALALTLQYFVQIRRNNIIPQPLIRQLDGLFASKRYADALALVREDRSAMGYVILRGMTAAQDGLVAMEQVMEDALEDRATRLHRGLEYINLIGSVAPMIGLFGTVHGIIGMFGSISESGGIPVMSRISHDLGTALVATFWGLLIAIPSLTCFGILRNRVDILMGECAAAAENLTARFRSAPTDGQPAGQPPRAVLEPSGPRAVVGPARSV